jgi:hypothetical protein
MERVAWLLGVPVDLYTIKAACDCVREFPKSTPISGVPKGAMMSFIRNRKMYECFRDGIRNLTQKASVPPIVYDCLTWVSRHMG